MCIFQYTRVLNLASVVTFPCWHSSRDEFCIIKKNNRFAKTKEGRNHRAGWRRIYQLSVVETPKEKESFWCSRQKRNSFRERISV